MNENITTTRYPDGRYHKVIRIDFPNSDPYYEIIESNYDTNVKFNDKYLSSMNENNNKRCVSCGAPNTKIGNKICHYCGSEI